MSDEEDGKDDYFLEMSHCGLKVTGQGSYVEFFKTGFLAALTSSRRVTGRE